MDYQIKQYALQQGALEIEYIEEFFNEYPRRKKAAEIIARLSGRAHQILMAEAPFPDDPTATPLPLSYKVAHELEKHREMLRDAGREREEIMKRTLQEADQVRADLVAKARVESEQLVERAKDQISREKAQAIHELRAQVADLAVEAPSKIVVSSLTPEAQKKLVSDYIAGLPKAQ